MKPCIPDCILTALRLRKVCCNRGQGYAAVFLKEAVQNQTLLYLDGNFEFATLGTFIASEEAVLDSPIPDFTNNPTDVRTRSPTLAPSVSWLPSADAPMTFLESTVDATTITMVISLDANPGKCHLKQPWLQSVIDHTELILCCLCSRDWSSAFQTREWPIPSRYQPRFLQCSIVRRENFLPTDCCQQCGWHRSSARSY